MKKSICRAFAIAFAVSIMLTTVIPASAAQPPVRKFCPTFDPERNRSRQVWTETMENPPSERW